ncbi:hypothetical protein [Trichloromonas sp.]|uniref:hypothetical protein n=1 Tax=Trichloromonas sp. TaxID=3069249 RepID=UPI002A458A2D|nr:hypothetical protein [Trichloromonas sp.]
MKKAGKTELKDVMYALGEIFSGTCFSNTEFDYLNVLKSTIETLSEKEKSQLYQWFLDAYTGDNSITFNSFVYENYRDDFSLENLTKTITSAMSLNDFYEIYWNLSRRFFVRSDVPTKIFKPYADVVRGHFDKIVSMLKQSKIVVAPAYQKKSEIKTIAILSPQILGMAHSPTREAFNLACHLIKNHGCKVSIINCNSMNYNNYLGFYSPFVANRNTELTGHQSLTIDYLNFKDVEIEVFTLDETLMSVRKINNFMNYIDQLQPDAVLAHGENLLFQELLFQKIPSVFVTTGATVPIAHSDAYWIPGNLFSDAGEEYAHAWGHTDFMRESMIVTPADAADEPLERSRFGFSKDDFLFLVAGTRLASELDNDFVEFCRELVAKCPHAKVVFAGSGDLDIRRTFGTLTNFERKFINVGMIQEFSAFCLMCDAFINPKRQGGGTSAQTAMMNHLPIVTMNFGHISSTVPESYRLQDYAEMLNYSVKLYSDNDFLAQEKVFFYNHFISDLKTDQQVAKIFKKLEEIHRRY